jgi:hypothetical protein
MRSNESGARPDGHCIMVAAAVPQCSPYRRCFFASRGVRLSAKVARVEPQFES